MTDNDLNLLIESVPNLIKLAQKINSESQNYGFGSIRNKTAINLAIKMERNLILNKNNYENIDNS